MLDHGLDDGFQIQCHLTSADRKHKVYHNIRVGSAKVKLGKLISLLFKIAINLMDSKQKEGSQVR